MSLHALLVAAFSVAAAAIYADEANTNDYHLPLLGFPVAQNTFFHQPHVDSKASLLYTLSEKSVLAAVNPKDGAVVWRHILVSNSSAAASRLVASSNQDTLFTVVDGNVNAWHAADGRLIWAKTFEDSNVKDSTSVGPLAGEERKQGDALVLVEGVRPGVYRLDGMSGNTIWVAEDSRHAFLFLFSLQR